MYYYNFYGNMITVTRLPLMDNQELKVLLGKCMHKVTEADPDGVCGVCSPPPPLLSPIYFIFMGNFSKS